MARWFRYVATILVLLATVALCAQTWAQPTPGDKRAPRPGGLGFEFEGFGPVVGGPGRDVSMMYGILLNAPTVQKDLKLVDDQKAKFKEANKKAQAATREMFSGMRDLSQEQRRERMREIGKKGMQARAEATKKLIEQTLLPHQLERVKGIALQRMGIWALNDKQIQQDLKLPEDQVAKITLIGEEWHKKMQDLVAGTRDLSPEDRQAKTAGVVQKMEEMRKPTETKLMNVLTADQKESLEKMKGQELEIPASELGGPRGSGPGGERRRPPPRKQD